MAHLHSVYDSDMHFSIDPITRVILNESSKKSIVQYDHNSERFTFELPRYIEDHDMSLCNRVEIHYINIGSGGVRNEDVYVVDDLQTSPDDDSVVICSWLISANATQLAGSLNFLLRFACVADDGTIDYAWHTEICKGITVSSGMNNGEAVAAEFPDVLEAWKREVLADINESIDDAATDSKYFDIDYDGIISLKPEYRGCPGCADDTNASTVNDYPYAISDNGVGVAGSKIDELPQEIVIPEIIGNTVVTGFQAGMFYFNLRVTKIVFPVGVTSIPDFFCDDARYIRSIENTEHIKKIGVKAFRNSGFDKALFPNLKEMGTGAFLQCKLLTVIDIGDNITEIPMNAFTGCGNLSCVVGGGNVTAVGQYGFPICYRLKNLPFLSQLTSIGNSAFIASRVQFDWSTLTNCTFGKYSTPVIDNTTDYWSGCTYTPCENPLNSVFDQKDPRWANESMGTSGVPYSKGCAIISLLHIHSALSGKTYDSPVQFVDELAQTYGVDTSVQIAGHDLTASVAEKLGYTVTKVNSIITAADYQLMLNKLASGAYVFVNIGQFTNPNGGHAVALYGINDIGEVKAVDSDFGYYLVGEYKAETYEIPFQNFTGPDSDFIIIEKA